MESVHRGRTTRAALSPKHCAVPQTSAVAGHFQTWPSPLPLLGKESYASQSSSAGDNLCDILAFAQISEAGVHLVQVEMVKISRDTPEPSLIRYAADQIRAGQVLGMPTDTFYGLAADPFNLRAVDRVYEIKSRSRHKPLSLLIEDVDQAEELAKPLPDEFRALAKKFWPGPLTIIVKAASRLPLKVTANTGNVALRIPNSAIPLAVVQAARIPITATSANLSGESECTTADAVREQLGVRIPIIVDGGTSPRDVASTIVDLTDEEARWKVLREGAIPSHEISEFFAQG